MTSYLDHYLISQPLIFSIHILHLSCTCNLTFFNGFLKVTVFVSQETSSVTILNSSHPTGRGPSMPLYVLAICLPLAALLGFVLACVYFKRNKEDQRVRYSVTVEISAEKPDYEMKRMYSVIDVSSGINKDFLSGLESKKASSEILDQLDGISVSVTKPDQTV